jgi:hypothetical protein
VGQGNVLSLIMINAVIDEILKQNIGQALKMLITEGDVV